MNAPIFCPHCRSELVYEYGDVYEDGMHQINRWHSIPRLFQAVWVSCDVCGCYSRDEIRPYEPLFDPEQSDGTPRFFDPQEDSEDDH